MVQLLSILFSVAGTDRLCEYLETAEASALSTTRVDLHLSLARALLLTSLWKYLRELAELMNLNVLAC